ncbi:hypothetical protein WN944_009556 [Citrus x changshan-huyou]|uniref:Uncharacterized protein n=1 Tax=Citrus x changshan-huyou TaxID=2935761 RepID=A0AAP0MQ32_9ROSI
MAGNGRTGRVKVAGRVGFPGQNGARLLDPPLPPPLMAKRQSHGGTIATFLVNCTCLMFMDVGNNNLSLNSQLLRNSTLIRVLDMRMNGFEEASLKCLQRIVS